MNVNIVRYFDPMIYLGNVVRTSSTVGHLKNDGTVDTTSYATSALAALEIWMTAQTDPEEAVREYLDLTNCHGEYYFLYTLEMCGIEDPLQEEEIRKIAEAVRDYLSAGEILENAA